MRYLLLYAEKELLADFSVFCLFRVGCEEARGKSENEGESYCYIKQVLCSWFPKVIGNTVVTRHYSTSDAALQ